MQSIWVLDPDSCTAVCTVRTAVVSRPCSRCGMGQTIWASPLQIEWYSAYTRRVGDLTALDRSEVSRSLLVSNRLRRFLEVRCAGLTFQPVEELNPDEMSCDAKCRPFWQLIPPILRPDPKALHWRKHGKPCRECLRSQYSGPMDGPYLITPADLAGFSLFEVEQLFPGVFIVDSLRQELEKKAFINLDCSGRAIVQLVADAALKDLVVPSPRRPHSKVSISTLPPNTPASCPISVAEIIDYVRLESADVNEASEERLHFVKAVAVADSRWWLWRYTEQSGDKCYVYYFLDPKGHSVLGLGDVARRSPDAFLRSEYIALTHNGVCA